MTKLADQRNLDIYGNSPIPWSRASDLLEAVTASLQDKDHVSVTHWLSTVGPDGSPHAAGIGAIWVDDTFYFTSGDRTRKSRNLASNPKCAISVALPGLDLIVYGTAAKVTHEATLERLANVYAAQGWPVSVRDGAFVAEFSAPSAGPPPWALYVLRPTKALGVATAEPWGATRWRLAE